MHIYSRSHVASRPTVLSNAFSGAVYTIAVKYSIGAVITAFIGAVYATAIYTCVGHYSSGI